MHLLLLLLLACKGGPDDTAQHPGGELDADGDGVPASEDCDDSDPEVGEPPTWYVDDDGDSWGNPDRPVVACEQPAGTASNDLDCDDGDPGEPVVADAARGSAGAAGTAADPLASLAEAVERARACAVARAGSYEGPIELDRDLWIAGVAGADGCSVTAGEGPALLVSGGRVRVQGFTFRDSHSSGDGGAVQAEGADALEIVDCAFTGNRAEGCGGALRGPSWGELSVSRTSFRDNRAGQGGALCVEDARLEDVLLEGNEAEEGGGLYLGGAVEAEELECRENRAGEGGGLYLAAGASFQGEQVVVEGNEAEERGGGAALAENATLSGLTLSENRAEEGGGASLASEASLLDARLRENTASLGGGAWGTGALLLSGIQLEGNAAEEGGGLYLEDFDARLSDSSAIGNMAATGGGLYLLDGELVVNGTSVAGNLAEQGAGIALSGVEVDAASDAECRGNTAGQSGGGLFAPGVGRWSGGSFSGNLAENGGALYLQGDFELEGAELIENTAQSQGGGAYVEGSLALSSCQLEGNRALLGAGLLVASGAAVSLESSQVRANVAGDGGGGAWVGGSLHSAGSDWGTGAEDNVPDDVRAGGDSYSALGGAFDCTATGCTSAR